MSYVLKSNCFTGERFDVIVKADQLPSKYPIHVQGLQDCRHLFLQAFIVYDDLSLDVAVKKEFSMCFNRTQLMIAEEGYDCHRLMAGIVCALDLKGQKGTLVESTSEEIIYIPFDINSFSNVSDKMTDNSYNLYEHTFYPTYLSLNEGTQRIPQINGMSFKYPSSPILSQPENIPEETICSLDERSDQCAYTPFFCECLQILEVPPKRIIQIILIDEGFGGNLTHTFHSHGYNVRILGRGSFGRPIHKDEIISLDRNGMIPRNIVNSLKKDTFAIPNKGYVILQFYSDNIGHWLWEVRSTATSPGTLGPGMQFLMSVGPRKNLPYVPNNFPACGNNKGPDLIFDSS